MTIGRLYTTLKTYTNYFLSIYHFQLFVFKAIADPGMSNSDKNWKVAQTNLSAVADVYLTNKCIGDK